MAWDRVSSAKRAGGLGVRSFEIGNLALTAKLGWRLQQEQDSRWGSPRTFALDL